MSQDTAVAVLSYSVYVNIWPVLSSVLQEYTDSAQDGSVLCATRVPRQDSRYRWSSPLLYEGQEDRTQYHKNV